MASYYVWSGAAGAADGTSWANAFVTLQAAMAAPRVAGDVFFVAHDHVQTQATTPLTFTSVGTEANPCKIFCVDRGGSVPPVSADLRTTAQLSMTIAGSIATGGSVSECYGLQIIAGSTSILASFNLNTTSKTWRFVNCIFKINSTGSSCRFNLGAAGALTVLEGCSFQAGNTPQTIVPIGRVIMRNCNLAGAAQIQNILFAPAAGTTSVFCEGCDFSQLAGGARFLALGTTATTSSIVLKDCKLGGAVGIFSGATLSPGGLMLTLIRCDSGDVNYAVSKYDYLGGQLVDASIFRTGGASDGTTPISWFIANNLSSSLIGESLPIVVWNETIGSAITVTLQCIWGGGAAPYNDKVWMECQYLGTSGFPISSKVSSGLADGLATPAQYPAGSGTWSGSTTKFAMSVTFTPQEKGFITLYVKTAGVAGGIYYVDPKPIIT